MENKPMKEAKLRVSNCPSEASTAQIGKVAIEEAERFYSLALQGNEDAARVLIQVGNYIASALFLLWARRGATNQREILRKLAAQENKFPVSYHSQKNDNQGWEEMVKNLGIGSAGPLRTDMYEKSQPDVIDAAIDLFITPYQIWQSKPIRSRPEEFKKHMELTRENASKLAKHIVKMWEQNNPGFPTFNTEPQAFLTLGRNFKKRIDRKKRTLERKRNRSKTNDAISMSWTAAKQKKWQIADTEHWKGIESTALAEMRQTDADIRADLTEAITSRLRQRLKSSPKMTR